MSAAAQTLTMIAVIVNEANGIKSLTRDQVEGIFTGAITDWSEVGGKAGRYLAAALLTLAWQG